MRLQFTHQQIAPWNDVELALLSGAQMIFNSLPSSLRLKNVTFRRTTMLSSTDRAGDSNQQLFKCVPSDGRSEKRGQTM